MQFSTIVHVIQSTVWATRLQWLYTQQGITGMHMNDFSINNAPLIIGLLFKGEWQSSLSSRGRRGPCVSGKAWFTFWKVHLIPGGVCLSFSVNTDSELSLLWKTHQSFTHKLHYGCLTCLFIYFLSQLVCCWKPMSKSIDINILYTCHGWWCFI